MAENAKDSRGVKMNVLSLFDGMSCGQQAIDRLGVKNYNYYASEIKPHAIQVTQHNYPDTIQIGDVTKVRYLNGFLITENGMFFVGKIDVVIGGSPCQDFSRGNKERDGLDGLKSSLFFEYVRILKEINPKYFLLENVVMAINDNNFITKLLRVEPVRINSSLVSPQLRDRYYWTNIPGQEIGLFGAMQGQPRDRKIKINDILGSGYYPGEKARCLLESDSRPLSTPVKMFHRFYGTGFTTLIFKTEGHYIDCKNHYDNHFKGKTAKCIDDFNGDLSVYDGVRYMNQVELERCQTVNVGYTSILKRNEAACLLGDGWTVDVIAHIMQGVK